MFLYFYALEHLIRRNKPESLMIWSRLEMSEMRNEKSRLCSETSRFIL